MINFCTDAIPTVESSFVTDFYHHINVAMDAEAILFIHDLITSYVKEKDKGVYCHISLVLDDLFIHSLTFTLF